MISSSISAASTATGRRRQEVQAAGVRQGQLTDQGLVQAAPPRGPRRKSEVVGVRSSSEAHTPICSEASTSSTWSRMPHGQPAGRVHRQRRLAHAALVADEGDDPADLARLAKADRRMRRSRSASSLRGDGPPQEILDARADGLDQDGALRDVGPEAFGPEHGGHGRLRRDHRRLLGKACKRPNVGPHFDQGKLGTTAGGGLDRLPRRRPRDGPPE